MIQLHATDSTYYPDFRYTTSISLPLHKCKLSNGKQDIWDDGTSFDVRSVSFTLQTNEADTSAIGSLFHDTERSKNLILTTAQSDGFYPFGSDLGYGDFTCAMTNFSVSGKSDLPYKYHEVSLDLTLKSGPSYSYTAPTTEGTFAIGDASNLMMPQQLFQPLIDMDNNFSVTRSGSVNYADRRSDAVSSKFKVQACPNNTARLIHQITKHIRGNSFNVANYNAVAPWTPGNVMLDNFVIKITHDSPNRMTTALEVIRV